jgi:hypothetical protein
MNLLKTNSLKVFNIIMLSQNSILLRVSVENLTACMWQHSIVNAELHVVAVVAIG